MDPNIVRILGSPDTWLKDLPDNHGKLIQFSSFHLGASAVRV